MSDCVEFCFPITRIACACGTGPGQDTQYDLSKGCPRCGTGSPMVSPLRLIASALPAKREVAETHRGEVLWRDGLVREIRRTFDLGPEFFRPVEKKRTHERLPWRHIYSPVTHPRLDRRSKGVVIERPQCPLCKRESFFESRVRHCKSVASMARRLTWPPILMSWEHYGNSMLNPPDDRFEQGFATPRVILRADIGAWLKERVRSAVDIVPIEYLPGPLRPLQ